MNHTQIDPEALKQVNEQMDREWREYQRDEMGFWEIVTLAVVVLLAVGVTVYPALTIIGVTK